MVLVSKYWEFVKLDSTSKRQVEMVITAQNYLQTQFSLAETSDAAIQRHLWEQIQQPTGGQSEIAEVCLRCYISHQTYQVCLDLGVKFGSRNGFSCEDLLPFVLDDEVLLASANQPKNKQRTTYQSLATTILKTFDPAKGSLNTWVNRYVKQQPELKRFLLQHGVYLVSDWALLNDTNPKELQRILSSMYGLTEIEIKQSCDLLVSYHAVYREDRLQQRLTGSTLPCLPPTSQQLTRIAEYLQTSVGKTLNPDAVLRQLQAISLKLRKYRIAAQGGAVTSISFDKPEIQPIIERNQPPSDDEEQIQFLKLYQNQFLESLDLAIAQVIGDLFDKLQAKRQPAGESFLKALHLFHCQGESMTQIAPQIGLTKQYEVTRFLKLNDLRGDIRQKLLLILRSKVIAIAKEFTDSVSLQNLDNQVEAILDEQIATVIQEAESEVKNPVRNQPLKSLFARRICRYLKSRDNR